MDNIFNVLEQSTILHIKGAFTKEECEIVCKQILAYKDSQPVNKDVNANGNCWRGRPQHHGGFSNEVGSMIIKRIADGTRSYLNSLPVPTNIRRQDTAHYDTSELTFSAWCNVNEKGGENREHSHAGSLMSGCAYFQSTGTGAIDYMPANLLYRATHEAWPYHGIARYEPEDGDLILFPSYLLHKVMPNPIDRQRINMAFNVNLKVTEDPVA